MNNLISFIAAILILAGTFYVAGKIQGSDAVMALNAQEYVIYAPEYEDEELYYLNAGYGERVITQLILHDDIIDLNRKYMELGGTSDLIAAFSSSGVDKNGNRTCYVHIVKPEGWNDKERFQSLGHEVMHCFGARHIGDIKS